MVTDQTTRPAQVNLTTGDLGAQAEFLAGSMGGVHVKAGDIDANWTAFAPRQPTLHAASPHATPPGAPCCSYR